jgi:plastocyanin
MRRTVLTALLVLTVTVVGACGDDDGSDAASPTTIAKESSGTTGNAITIKDFAFAPTPLEVTAGATVKVANNDSTAHTVTADDKGFDTGPVDAGGDKTFTAPSAPGDYSFHCSIHSTMKGSIRVSG